MKQQPMLELIEEVETLGHAGVVMPFDIMNLASRLAGHPERDTVTGKLVIWMDHPSNFIRHIATRTLQLMGADSLDEAVFAKALRMVQTDDAPNVRAEAIRLLAKSKRHGPEFVVALADAADRDDTDYVRDAAREALALLPVSWVRKTS
jgi:HEAT repeats